MSYDGTLKFDTKIDTDSFNTGVSKLGGLASGALSTAIKGLTATTAGLGALGAASYEAGSAWEAGMSEVSAISGATGEDLEQLKEYGLDVAKTSKFSAAETAEAYKYMGMAGWDAGQMMDGLAGIMNLAAAAGEDLGTTSDIVTDGLTAFGLSAKDSAHFADVLAAAATSSNTNVSMMGDTFKYAAPIVGSLYKNAGDAAEAMEDSAVAIGLMANSGIKASQAGTSLRSMLTRIATNAGKSSTSMGALDVLTEKLGVQFYDTSGNVRDMSTVLSECRSAWSSLSAEEQTSYAKTIAGQYAMSGWLAVMNAAPEDVEKVTNAIKNCDGAAQEMADTMLDNLPGALTRLSSTFDILKVSIYEKMQEPLKEAVIFAKGQLDVLQEAFDKGGFQGLVTAIGEVLSNVVGEIAKHAPAIIDAASNLMRSFGESLINKIGQMKHTGEVGRLVVSLFEGVGTYIEVFSRVAIELVGALGKAIVDNAPRLKASASQMLHNILETFSNNASDIGAGAAKLILILAGALSNNMPKLIECAGKLIAGFAKGLADDPKALADAAPVLLTFFGSKLLSSAGSILFSIGGKLIGHIVEGMVTAAGGSFGSVISAISSALSGIGAAIGPVITTIGGIGAAIGGGILAIKEFVDMWKGGWDVIKTILEALGLAIAAVGAVILGAPAAIAAAIAAIIFVVSQIAIVIHDNWEAIGKFFTDIGEGISKWWESVKQFFANLGEGIKKGVEDFIEGGKNLIEGLYNGIQEKIAGAFAWVKEHIVDPVVNAVKSLFGINSPSTVFAEIGAFLVEGLWMGIQNMWESFIGFLGTLVASVIEWGSNLIASVTEVVTGAITMITEFFAELPAQIMEFLTGVLTAIAEWGISLLDSISEAVSPAIEAAVTFFSELPTKVSEFFSEIIESVIEWGSQLLENMGKAAKEAIDKVVSFFTELPGKLKALFDDTVGKAIEWGKSMLKEMGDKAKETFDVVAKWFSEMPGKIKEFLDDIIGKIMVWGADLVEKVSTFAQNAVNAAIEFFSKLPGEIWNFLSDIINKVVEWGSQLLSSISEAVTNAVNAAIDLFKKFVEDVKNKLKEVIDAVVQWGKDLIANAEKAINGFIEKIVNGLQQVVQHFVKKFNEVIENARKFVSDLAQKGMEAAIGFKNKIIDGFKGIVDTVKRIGSDIVEGIWNGIKGAWDSLTSRVQSAASSLVDAIKSKLRIGSPSRVFADEVGRMIPAGIEEGVKEGMPSLTNTLVSQVGAITTEASKQVTKTLYDSRAEASKAMSTALSSIMPEDLADQRKEAEDRAIKNIEDVLKTKTWTKIEVEKIDNNADEEKQQILNKYNPELLDLSQKKLNANSEADIRAIEEKEIEIQEKMAEEIAEVEKNRDNALLKFASFVSVDKYSKDLAMKIAAIEAEKVQTLKEISKQEAEAKAIELEETSVDMSVVTEDYEVLADKLKASVMSELSTVVDNLVAKVTQQGEGGGDTYIDQHIEQTNEYNVPVATPSEVAKEQRENVRKLAAGG